MLVKSWMSQEVITVTGSDTLVEVEQLFEEHNLRRIPVIEGDLVTGIICDTDILKAKPSILDPGNAVLEVERFSQLLVQHVMTDGPVTVSVDDTLENALLVMRRHKINSIPVVKEGSLVGIITETNIFNAFLTALGAETGGTRLEVMIGRKSASLHSLLDVFQQHDMAILSVVYQFEYSENFSKVTIRTTGENMDALLDALWEHEFKVNRVN